MFIEGRIFPEIGFVGNAEKAVVTGQFGLNGGASVLASRSLWLVSSLAPPNCHYQDGAIMTKGQLREEQTIA